MDVGERVAARDDDIGALAGLKDAGLLPRYPAATRRRAPPPGCTDGRARAARLPHLRIADRAVALRAVKLMGRLLDPAGRAGGFVPMNLWA
ncbi:hypothetical protein [Streptomyces atratus]|uniref:hypothetical protein n=1 Tax=Streptomyces atratus TaxID=1893 RepID=UPI0033D25399